MEINKFVKNYRELNFPVDTCAKRFLNIGQRYIDRNNDLLSQVGIEEIVLIEYKKLNNILQDMYDLFEIVKILYDNIDARNKLLVEYLSDEN